MADNIFQLEIITPERIFYKGQVRMVEFTTQNGRIGVLKDHIPLTTLIVPGVLILKETGDEKQAALQEGFAEILPDKVTILAEAADWQKEN